MRISEISRKTSETDIRLKLNIDGQGIGSIETGIGFFNHMLNLFTRHSAFDLELNAVGDLHVDFHHTVEDVGLCLGTAFRQAVGDKRGIRRYGFSSLPMDETLVNVSIDVSGRPHLNLINPMENRTVGDFPLDLLKVFFQAFSDRGGITAHTILITGSNPHHAAEAMFKGFARALREAVEKDSRVQGVPSTKGSLD
ncbi:MAG: imidazoleglycerol-phosphate dehydratase HisB [Deltaproteobacteria bacterium]|nr:imidazoleglycerol-phosphate dehydratase HisB [Deltaproteobacteria bacterium]